MATIKITEMGQIPNIDNVDVLPIVDISTDTTNKVTIQQLKTIAPVQSVASKTGNVTLTKNDVGLDNVDNTSDANKPISTATSAALDNKQNVLISGTNIKTINSTSLLGSGNIEISATTNWGSIGGTLSNQTDLQSALDAKQNSLGYTAENQSNKSQNVNTDQASTTKYPSVKAVFDWAVGLFIQKNAAITGATKTKITFDANGLVTAGADLAASDIPSGIDAAKIGAGSVDNTEFAYLNGVTSGIQSQLNAKAPSTGINATAIATGVVDNTEFEYLNGVTSAIQTQLDAKAPSTGINATAIGSGSVDNTEFGYLNGVTSAIQTQVDSKIAKYDGATYDINSLAAVTQAEYDAIGTKSTTTIYFII
jgi:hypothetical protein